MTEQERLRIIADTIAEIRPMVQNDGGDLELAGVEGNRVLVHLKGQCLSCALAGQTLGGIRRKLMAVLDEPVMVVPAPHPVAAG
ncbi:NifU family protein [Magnetospirillum sulfuroxidans]|uniref:NifU family protein n=1 Tax=Magnetospirillum sulfuroxidans TaxID=611300 RepID=A0ABS5IGA1_9PROT|nr:NifU family protein [Magnetospirillum sulfuroxidans]MBR9973442.1 NifU family protein [Magnetospirillum sulfuroxidans]